MQEQLDLVTQIYQSVVEVLVNYSFQAFGAIVVLIAGFAVGGWVARGLLRVQERRDVDVTLRQLIAGAGKGIVIGLFLIVAMSQMGISITPLIAAIGGLAVGASFAIQGPVSNYGAGLVIILTRMYKVGDTITTQGCAGLVDDISLATTVLVTEDGERIVIPNKQIAGEIHTNSYQNRLVEGRIGVAYSDDPVQAIGVLREALVGVDGVTRDPSPQVGIAAFGDSSVDLDYRFWVPTDRYFELLHRANLAVFQAVGESGLTIPFPQREVQVLSTGT